MVIPAEVADPVDQQRSDAVHCLHAGFVCLFGGPFHRNDAWYHLSGEWLKVVAPGRPPAYVWLNGHGFPSERDYNNDEPLEVVVVMNNNPRE